MGTVVLFSVVQQLDMKLAAQLQPVPWLRIHETIPSLPNTSLWCCACLVQHRCNFTAPYFLIESKHLYRNTRHIIHPTPIDYSFILLKAKHSGLLISWLWNRSHWTDLYKTKPNLVKWLNYFSLLVKSGSNSYRVIKVYMPHLSSLKSELHTKKALQQTPTFLWKY